MTIVSYKNFVLIKNKKTNIIKKYRIADIDSLSDLNIKNDAKITFKLNRQWLSEKNRYIIEKLSSGHEVINNTLYPVDDITKHYEQVDEFVSKKRASLTMNDDDITALTELIAKYNKSTINKYTRKI